MGDEAIIEFYNRRRMTRSQFKQFLLYGKTLCHLPQDICKERWRALFETGESVCRIDMMKDENGSITYSPEGTGFHLGGGWIMTNQHVICHKDEEKSCASIARFIFPGKTIDPAPRNVIFSYFQDPDGTTAVNDSKKDLALIHVEEITSDTDVKIPALVNVMQEPAKEGHRVFLVHYGDGVKDKQDPPQQFSVSDNIMCFSVENANGNRFSVHTAHSRPGSSGAPLLVFSESQKKFLVAAVHYAGPESAEIIDSPGFALWYSREDWLQETVRVASNAHRIRLLTEFAENNTCTTDLANLKEMFVRLQEHLDKYSLRLALKVKRPEGIDFTSKTIIFAASNY